MLFKKRKKFLMLSPKLIHPSPNRMRLNIDEKHLKNLTKSIAEIGIIEPLVIRKTDTGFELISGEYRLRAALGLGIRKVPCVLIKKTALSASVACICENTIRKVPTVLENAMAIERLMLLYGLTSEDIAEKLCLTKSQVEENLKILNLENSLKQKIALKEFKSEEVNKLFNKNEETEEQVCMQKASFCDIRLFQNSMQKLLSRLNSAGFTANTRKTETDDYVEYKIRVIKTKKEIHEQLKIC